MKERKKKRTDKESAASFSFPTLLNRIPSDGTYVKLKSSGKENSLNIN